MENFEHLRRSRLILLTSRAVDDVAAHRPVRMSIDHSGNGFVWIPRRLPLVGRLNSCPYVRVAPCDLRGRPTGSDQPALANRYPPVADSDVGKSPGNGEGSGPAPIARESGLLALAERLKRAFVCYRITPAEEPTPWQQRIASHFDGGAQ